MQETQQKSAILNLVLFCLEFQGDIIEQIPPGELTRSTFGQQD